VEVDAAEVSQQLSTVTKEFQKYARIPGFRAGHAPVAFIEKRFAKEIQDEVNRKTFLSRTDKRSPTTNCAW